MVQVLDYFRRLYKKETSKEYEIPNNPLKDVKYLFTPTWEYVCWLEQRLDKYEKEPRPETTMTTTAYCGSHDIRSQNERI